MKTKVCFFINTLDNSGGTERVTAVLASELVQRGYEVHIITWYGGHVSFYTIDSNIKLHYIFDQRFGNIYKDYFRSLVKYRALLKSIEPDYLIDVCVALSLLSIPAIVGLGIKLIAWEHFNTGVSWNPYTAKISRLLAAKYASLVVTLTQSDKVQYQKRFGASRVLCIPNPVTLKPAHTSDLNSKTVLAVGRFTEQKGFDLLMSIWKDVTDEVDGWTLVVVGDGECKQAILEQVRTLALTDRVRIVEPTTNIAQYYEKSSIYVMTSRYEGLPLVLIEAKAFGLPIISYDCETGPRDIVNHGKDGVLIPHLDQSRFKDELIELMGDRQKREQFSRHALADVKRFDLESVLQTWEALLK